MSKYIYNPRLKGKHRVFSQEMFDKYDIPARDKIKRVLTDFVSDHPDDKKQDLVITDPECKYKYLELQVCPSWIGETYPYEKVTVYERKSHYGEDTLFLTLNHDLSKGHLFNVKNFKEMTPHRLKKYSREFVYDIPWNRVMTVYIDDLTSDLINLY